MPDTCTSCQLALTHIRARRLLLLLPAHRDLAKGEEVTVDYTSTYWKPLGQALMIEQQKYARAALLQQEQLDRELQQALQQKLLSRQEVAEALRYNPDLEQLQTYTP